MSRKVGSFTNPNSGETDWFEPDTISMVILQSRMITKVGDTVQTAIDFELGNDNAKKVVTLQAKYTTNGTTFTSKIVEADELEFGAQFVDRVYADDALDNAKIVEEMKSEAIKDLTKRLMDNGVLIGGMEVEGIGFILVDGDKVLTVEELTFEYSVVENQPVNTVTLKNCVGQAALKNLNNPEIEFYTEGYKISVVNPQLKEEKEGRLKDYVVNASDVLVSKSSNMPKYTSFENFNPNDEAALEEFISSRKSLLDDTIEQDEDLDDRFGSLF